MPSPFDKGDYQPLDTFAFEALAVSTSTALTAATYGPSTGQPALSAAVQCQVASVRYRLDGTAPTAAIGTILEVGDEVIIWGTPDIASARFIAVGGAAVLAVHYAR